MGPLRCILSLGSHSGVRCRRRSPTAPPNRVALYLERLEDRIVPNHAPILDTSTTPTFVFVKENDPNPYGDRVGDIFGPVISDPDPGALTGIAVAGLTTGHGTWQYSLDGGTSWTAFPAVAETAALLLDSADQIRFVPASNFLGTMTLTERAWDETSGTVGGTADLTAGTGGSTAFSAAEGSATLTVTVTGNMAPVLDPNYPAKLTAVQVNAAPGPGNTVAQIVGPSITDRNHNAVQGIAVIGLVGGADGAWQYSLDGGSTWAPVGAVSLSSALLLRATDRVRFVPAQDFAGAGASITYHAWDQTQGSPGGTADLTNLDPINGAFSSASAMATVFVSYFSYDSSSQTLSINGTSGPDLLTFTTGSVDPGFFIATNLYFTMNGETQTYQSAPDGTGTISSVVINGNGGADVVAAYTNDSFHAPFNGGIVYDNATAVLGDDGGTISLSTSPITLKFSNWRYIDSYLGPHGTATLVDAAGFNTFASYGSYSYLYRYTAGNSSFVWGAGSVKALSSNGSYDTSVQYDGSGPSTYIVYGTGYAGMAGTDQGLSFNNSAQGHWVVNVAIAQHAGNVAYFYDSPGNDVFVGFSLYSYMYSDNPDGSLAEYDAAAGFASVVAGSIQGGVDYSYIYAANVSEYGFHRLV